MLQGAARPTLLPILPQLKLPLQMFHHDKPTATILLLLAETSWTGFGEHNRVIRAQGLAARLNNRVLAPQLPMLILKHREASLEDSRIRTDLPWMHTPRNLRQLQLQLLQFT